MFNKWWIHWYHWYHYQIMIHKLECLWFASMPCSFLPVVVAFDKPEGRDRDPNARPEATVASLAVRKTQPTTKKWDLKMEIPMDPEEEILDIWTSYDIMSFFQLCSTLNMLLLLLWKKKWPFHGYIQRSFLVLLFFHWTVMFEGRVHCSRKGSIRTNH